MELALIELYKLSNEQQSLIEITEKMLNAINSGDSRTYADLCSPDLTCYEDVCTHRIDGVEFHLTLINQMSQSPAMRATRCDILEPCVQIYGNSAIVTYTRLMTYDGSGVPRWATSNETRVFSNESGSWKMVHFHRTTL